MISRSGTWTATARAHASLARGGSQATSPAGGPAPRAAPARAPPPPPRPGAVRGTLELHATGDTMSIDAALRAGRGAARFRGLALLDSTRTWLRGSATLEAVGPRALVA